MKIIKLKKLERDCVKTIYIPDDSGYKGIFEHCTNGLNSLTKEQIPYYKEIFEMHGFELLVTHTLEKKDILYRVDDGQKFHYDKDLGQYFLKTSTCISVGHSFERFSPYFFTSEQSEINDA